MAVKYRLPCPCGKSIDVDASQSGLSVACVCGQSQEVPTHRGLQQLERIESAPPQTAQGRPSAAASTWGLRQGLRFLGVVIVLSAAAVLVYFALRPLQDDAILYLERADSFVALRFWEALRTGIDTSQSPPGKELIKWLEERRMLTLMSYAAAGVGALLIAISFLIPTRAKAR